MPRFVQNANGKGSLKAIQVLINKYPHVLNSKLAAINADPGIFDWRSPKAEDGFAEYSDQEFLNRIDADIKNRNLDTFWPKRGPQWDALGVCGPYRILVEAKANIPELVSPPSQARPHSMKLIRSSMDQVKDDLNIKNEKEWTGTFYQYTNRIAHLWFLTIANQIPAYLVNIYFVGDESVKGPKTKEEWIGALSLLRSYLGIARHKISKYMIDVFIDFEDIKT